MVCTQQDTSCRMECMTELPIVVDDGGSVDSSMMSSLDRKLASLGINVEDNIVPQDAQTEVPNRYGKPEFSPLGFCNPVKLLEGMTQVETVFECLGIGAYSEVYRCKVSGLERPAAVKILHSQLEDNREVELLKGLTHQNLVSLIDVIQGSPNALVLELCSGGSLLHLIHYRGCRSIFDSVSFKGKVQAALDVMKAVEYLHAKHVVHRDVKCGNCFLSTQAVEGCPMLPDVKLGDLGFARVAAASMTRAIGTVRFMAPEVISSNQYGFPADIFSSGVLLFELVSGRMPYASWGRATDAALAIAILKGLRPDFKEILPGGKMLQGILELCWACDVEVRPSAEEFRGYLDTCVGIVN